MPIKDGFFQDCFEWIIRAEGGFVDNSIDPGGATKYGITLKTLREFKQDETLSKSDIANLTLPVASEIYYERYWKALGLDGCINEIACRVIFDQAVNRGIHNVLSDVNHLLGTKLSPSFTTVIEVLNFYQQEYDKMPSLQLSFVINFLLMSQDHYLAIIRRDPKQVIFLQGWMGRLANLFRLFCR